MKTRFICILLICACLLTGCTAKESPPAVTQTPTEAPAQTSTAEPELKTGVGFYFDTVVQVTLYGPESGLLEEIWAACERYENLLSKTIANSDVSRINAAMGQPVTVDPETWEILRRAKEISAVTGGAFSITIAPVTALWTFTGTATNTVPNDETRLAALPLVDDQKIVLGENNTVTLPPGCRSTWAASPRATSPTRRRSSSGRRPRRPSSTWAATSTLWGRSRMARSSPWRSPIP